MKPGIYRAMSFDEYLSIPAINKSNLDFMEQSPAHFYANCLDPERKQREPTPAMELGTAIHCAILEPDRFETLYGLEPEVAPRRPTSRQLEAKKPSPDTVDAIEFWQNFDQKNRGRLILSADDWATCQAITRSVHSTASGQTLLESGDPEVVLVWRDPLEGVLCKGRVDWLTEGAIVDFKSTQDASPSAFARQVANMSWDIQAAWYIDALEALTGEKATFVFGAVEKTPPFACRFFFAGPDMLEIGRRLYRSRLKRFAECQRNQTWPSYPEEITELRPPAWRLNSEMEL